MFHSVSLLRFTQEKPHTLRAFVARQALEAGDAAIREYFSHMQKSGYPPASRVATYFIHHLREGK